MPVIAMTREMGSRGKDVALGVAERLGLEIVHHEIVEQSVARKMRLTEGSVHRFLEGEASLWERWKIDGRRLSRYTTEEILEIALSGNVIIRGWGAAQLLASVPHVVGVRVCAPMSARVTEMVRRLDDVSSDAARDEIERSDAAHDRIIRNHFEIDWRDPAAYAMTLNTQAVPIDVCVDCICELAAAPICAETPESVGALSDILVTERVRTAIEERGKLGPLNSSLEIVTRGGEVTLSCVVSVSTDVDALIDMVRAVKGVKSVKNEIKSLPHTYATFGA
ncbi:MAG: cytidylate kinase family protein [Pseudomonadota bacterium]